MFRFAGTVLVPVRKKRYGKLHGMTRKTAKPISQSYYISA
jgi:hypothetical protein